MNKMFADREQESPVPGQGLLLRITLGKDSLSST